MANPYSNYNYTEIVGEAVTKLQSYTNITSLSPGGKARALLEAVGSLHGTQLTRIKEGIDSFLLSSAVGTNLDLLGEIYGVPRRKAEPAAVYSVDRTVRIYTLANSFGEINSGVSIVIPVGTKLTATKSNNTIVNFVTTETTVLDPSLREAYLSIRSVTRGAEANVDIGQLSSIAFSNYTDSANDSLLVTNVAPVINGLSIEDDNNYRFRIRNAILSLTSGNLTALRLACLSVPGVADVQLIPYDRGIGTVSCIVQALTPSTPDYLIAAVQGAATEAAPAGNYVFVTKPIETGIQLEVTLKLKNISLISDRALIEDQVAQRVQEYINNLAIGEGLIINELISVVMDADTRIEDIGTTGKPFDNIYIYQYSRVSGSRIRKKIVANYLPDQQEKILIEQNISNPITIRSI